MFWRGNQRERTHLECLGLDGRLIGKIHLQEVGWVGAEWIAVAEHKDTLRAVVNEALKSWVP